MNWTAKARSMAVLLIAVAPAEFAAGQEGDDIVRPGAVLEGHSTSVQRDSRILAFEIDTPPDAR